MRLSFSAPLLLLTVLSSAHARVVYTSQDWQLDDTNGICTAVTVVETNFNTWRLELVRPKNLPAATEVFVRQTGRSAMSWRAALRDGSILSFANTGKDGRNDLFWQIPGNTQSLVLQLEDRKDIKFKPADNYRDPRLEFSSLGFSRVRQEMQKRCLAGSDLLNTDFESTFLKPVSRPVDPAALTPEVVRELRRLFADGHKTYLKRGVNATELSALRTRFKVQLDEATLLDASISSLSQIEIPDLQAAQIRNDNLETQSRADLARFVTAIPNLTQSVNSATISLNQAQAILAPYEAEHDTRESAAHSARSAVNSGLSRIAQIDSSRNSSLGQIRNLQYEMDRATQTANSANMELPSARMNASRAEADYRNFNPNQEMYDRLDRDYSYQNARRELHRAVREAHRLEQQVIYTRSDRDARDRELQQCRATAGADCSVLDSSLRAANDQLARIKDQARSAQSRASQLQSEIQFTEQRVRNDVENISIQLGNRMSEANRRLQELSDVVNRNQQRVSEISRYEIPRLNDQIIALDRERPIVEAEVNRQSPIATRLEAELASYEARVGWDAKVQGVGEAQSLLNSRQRELNSALSGKAKAEQTIAQTISERQRLAQILGLKQNQLASAFARREVVRVSLVPFEAERIRLDAITLSLNQEFEGFSQQFERLLPL